MTLDEAFQTATRNHASGQLREAEGLYRAVLARAPNHAETHHRLGVICFQTGRAEEAIQFVRRATELDPHQANYHSNLGVFLADLKQFDAAAGALQKALALNPNQPETHNNLANVLNELGRTEQAIHSYRNAISLRPDYVEAHYNLGNALGKFGQRREAIEMLQLAIAMRPTYAEAHASLANLLRDEGRIDEAIASCRRAIELRPDLGEAYNSLGAILQETGELEEAVGFYRRASQLTRDLRVSDNLLVLLHLDPANDAQAIFEQHALWNRNFARTFAPSSANFPNDLNPDRRLRIGYVSAYLNSHPVGRFLTPLLANHDHRQFEIVCYSDTIEPDATTDRLSACADQWRDTRGKTDEHLAQLVRADRIDILVDLGMHTKANRIFVFARKPAPVQVTYLAFCSTTGLETIDYRLSDAYLDPDDSQQRLYSERTVRLRSYWCYPAPAEASDPGPLPALTAGHVTFGCLNNFSKISRQAFSTWLEILNSVPESRLILNAPEGAHRQRAGDRATAAGVDADRLVFVGRAPMPQYFRRYQQIDIALDPTPYCGGTTTCDALWMGVPVVTLAGKTAVSRGGSSILHQIGLPELIAQSPEQYIQIATSLAHDLSRLADLRPNLRNRMQDSPLMDGPQFARDVEAAFRQMWRSYVGA
jgi:predicted O-linked N-acetylglucosamine transferase (SPINDLY family)